MAGPEGTRQPLSGRRLEWLRGELAAWRATGLINGEQAQRIADRYEPTWFARHATQFALWALAILMGAVGVLLVIGYNWDDMPRAVKAALIIAAVVASFGGSALAYSRRHPLAGELLGFMGVLLYGNAIWLLAQVFHMSGHYPDAAMWWMLGALLTAHLLDSPLTLALSLVLLAMWVGMEGISFSGDTWVVFPLLAAAALRLTYRFAVPTLLTVWGAVVLFWFFVQSLIASHAWPLAAVGLVYVAGGAAFATGLLHGERSRLRPTWLRMGAIYMAVGILPLMIKEVLGIPPSDGGPRRPLLVLGALLLAYAWLAAARRRVVREALPVLLSAAIVPAVLAVMAVRSPDGLPASQRLVFAIAFSALAIAMSVVLLRAGIRIDDLRLFAVGVGMALSFLVVRWIDLVGNMLWSALLLFATAAGLIALARMWRHRQPVSPGGGA